jgi:hypothetical protein
MSTRVLILAGATVLWLALVGAGSAALLDYAFTPGVSGAAPTQWPQGSVLSLKSNEATLVMVCIRTVRVPAPASPSFWP